MTAPLLGVLCILVGYICHSSGLDLLIADKIYTGFDGFPRNAFFLKTIMHEGMRGVTTFALSVLVMILAWDWVRPRQWLNTSRRQWRIFLACAAVFIGGVAALKAFTTPACPWDLTVFGGDRNQTNYADIFRTDLFGKGHCFPAGHSTSGYVWLCLAFLSSPHQPAFRRSVLLLLPLGLSLSAAQIFRGAHFLSHELTTVGIGLIVFSVLPRLLTLQPHVPRK